MTKKTFSFVLILITLFNINGLAQKKKKQTKILITTSYGEMKLVLYNETPKHRDNFINLVKEGFYDSTLFHRVIETFMIQGGDPESKNAKANKMLGNGGPGYTLPAEINPKIIHKRGALSAARMGDNVNPMRESSGSQFYIVQGKKSTQEELEQIGKRNGIVYTEEQIKEYTTNGGTPFLDMNYTVFGELIEGFDVIDKIAVVKKGRADRPKEDIKMTMKIVKK
jgi:cyclophilin family peptidyl-prolyl cis-trans isomerase